MSYPTGTCNHDITLVADPSTGVPPEGMYYDGTSDGIATDTMKQTQDNNLSAAAQSLVCTWWTGPWPQLHLQVLDPTGTYSCVIHVAINLLGTVDLVSLFLISWALSLFGITEGQWQIIMDVLMLALDGALMAAIGLGFYGALMAFMVVDASFIAGVLAIGIGLMILTLAGAWVVSDMLREQFSISAAFLFWLAIGVMAFNVFRQRGSADFAPNMSNKASDMFRFAQSRLGYSPGTKIGVSFGRFTYFFVGVVIAASILAMIHYWNLAGQ